MIVGKTFQALQNLTKQEFLALFVLKLQPYKSNPHSGVGSEMKGYLGLIWPNWGLK